ncbi:MAG TPA: type VII secretion target [Micromonosporaceae bacterium]
MERISTYADRIEQAGSVVTGTVDALAAAGPAGPDFGVEAPGALGELGQALHGQWQSALAAHIAQARAVADSLAETAESLRQAARAYADTDHAVRRRYAEER